MARARVIPRKELEEGIAAMVTTAPGSLTRFVGQVRQFICSLHGHDSLLHFEKGRLSLLCSTCGYETPGWDVKGAPAVQRGTVETKPRFIRMPALRMRRIA
jgi:hypothetical protein